MRFRRYMLYALDSLMSRGPAAILIPLGAIVIAVLVILTTAVIATGAMTIGELTLPDILWTVFGYMYVPVAVSPDQGGWPLRILLFLASLTGIVVLSTFISVITTSFATTITNLRKGKSIIEEHGHILIIGWSEQVYGIVQELIIAHENHTKSCIAILAPKDKVEMEDRLRARVRQSQSKKTSIVCRSGSPIDLTDLAIVRPERAKSIIILAPEDHPNPDSIVIKTMLALVHGDRSTNPPPIVTTMRDPENMEVASIVCGNRVRVVPSELVISQIITQTCRQAGLSRVYSELLDFGGDELYMKSEPHLEGKTFDEASRLFQHSTLVGLQQGDGQIVVNPHPATRFSANDRAILLSASEQTIVLNDQPIVEISAHLINTNDRTERQPERILILGWNERGQTIVTELEKYLVAGSNITVAGDVERSGGLMNLAAPTKSAMLSYTTGDPTSRNVLNSLQVSEYDSIIVLADPEAGGVQEADARTLMTVIHLRDILRNAQSNVNIVTEMLDDRNRELASVASDHDFIVSNKITSLLLTQIAENPDLAEVFAELFNAEGSELYLKPASHYVLCGKPVNFATVTEAAARKHEVAIGYRVFSQGNGSVRLNIPKSESYCYSTDDFIIVIAND